MRTRPVAIFSSLILLAAVWVSATASAQVSTAPAAVSSAGPYALPDLPYAVDALEPVIDAETMGLHHQRHHGAAVTQLNTLAASVPELRDGAVETVLARVSTLPPAVRNNLGSHYNHSLFWAVMAPQGQGGAPSDALAAAINQTFGSHEAFKTQFGQAAATRFGSGWAWLVVKADGSLAITSTPNQDNPLMDVADVRGTPILGLDVWEHAYYLKYRNLRGDYIGQWWNVVNWKEVNRRYAEVMPAK